MRGVATKTSVFVEIGSGVGGAANERCSSGVMVVGRLTLGAWLNMIKASDRVLRATGSTKNTFLLIPGILSDLPLLYKARGGISSLEKVGN